MKDKYDKPYNIRIPEEIKESVFEAARKEDRSFSGQIRHILRTWRSCKKDNNSIS